MPYIPIGTISRPHGFKGSFVVTTSLGKDSALAYLKKLYAGKSETDLQKLHVQEASWMPKGWKVTVKEIQSEEALSPFLSQTVFADREELEAPKENEYYVSDLVGLAVVDFETGSPLGTFLELEEVATGNGKIVQHTWKIKLANGTTLDVPAVKHFIHSVSLKEKKISLQNLKDLESDE